VGEYISEGQITRADWTPLIGAPTLTAGATYYLSSDVPGQLTIVAPTTSGQYVVLVGRAVSNLSLDIEIAPPIRL
jgi:hypothetical protein